MPQRSKDVFKPVVSWLDICLLLGQDPSQGLEAFQLLEDRFFVSNVEVTDGKNVLELRAIFLQFLLNSF